MLISESDYHAYVPTMVEGQREGDSKAPLSQREFAGILRLLPSLKSGSLTVSVNQLPMLKVEPESRSLSVDAAGIRESGLSLRRMLAGGGEGESVRRLLSSSESMAKELSEIGWTLTLYDRGSRMLSMGRGVSRLTGHMRANPLKLRKLLRTL